MASIRSVAGAVAPSSFRAVSDEHRAPTSSGRCSLKSSSLFGSGLDLPVLSRKFTLADAVTLQGGVARAQGLEDGAQPLPASHRYKVASQAAFEHLRNVSNNREFTFHSLPCPISKNVFHSHLSVQTLSFSEFVVTGVNMFLVEKNAREKLSFCAPTCMHSL